MHPRISSLLLLVLACGSDAPQTSSTPTNDPPPTGYAIHEWGLVHFGVGEALGMATAGPGHFPAPAEGTIGIGDIGTVAFKPVLYAHLEDGAAEARFDAEVRVPGGSLPEHWPDGARSDDDQGSRVVWSGVVASRGTCSGQSYPSIDSERCRLPDDFCEAAELASYETSDAACLLVGGARYNHLFYRAGVPSTGPLEILLDEGVATVRHRGQHPIPGKIMRVLRDPSGAATRVVFVDPPPPGQSITLALPDGSTEAASGADLMRAIEGHLESIGLTESERQAFARAWTQDLIGGDDETPPVQRTTSPPLVSAPDAILYWLGEDDAAALLPLRFEPAPVALRRGLLARVHLIPGTTPTAALHLRAWRVETGADGVSPEVIRRALRMRLRVLQSCFESSESAAPLDLSFGIQAVIGPDGSTREVTTQSDSASFAAFQPCVQAALEQITYPRPETGQPTPFRTGYAVAGTPVSGTPVSGTPTDR